MKELKAFWALAAFAFVVLGGAAVWVGGLNQDEGWYLYAANLVAEGKLPYRDFFFTQGPVMPLVYSAFVSAWKAGGILGARILTLALGALGILVFAGLARRLVPEGRRNAAALSVVLLLGCNLYHLYYVAIPKTYALAGLFVATGFYALSFVFRPSSPRKWMLGRDEPVFAVCSGLCLSLAAGTRISLGALLCVVGVALFASRRWRALFGFCVGGLAGLLAVYVVPAVCDAGFREGFWAAQQYHAARGGFDLTWTVGSLSRLVRWYLPVFVVLGLGWGIEVKVKGDGERRNGPSLLLFSFLAVFVVQMLAPFPYEDYQVPVMGLIAVYAAVNFVGNVNTPPFTFASHLHLLLVLGLTFANSFGSPLLEKWMTNGQDRFWSLKKEKTELAQLRDVARRIEALDPQGGTLLTQDLYLAIETGRKVPAGLEMGPFAMLSDADWRKLLLQTAPAECPVAALSGYTFAVNPPACDERPIDRQMEYWGLLKRHYELVEREEAFGQNATALLVLKRK